MSHTAISSVTGSGQRCNHQADDSLQFNGFIYMPHALRTESSSQMRSFRKWTAM